MRTTSVGDIVFSILSLIAVACFAALISLQVMEWKYYEDPLEPHGGNIWPIVTQTAADRK